MTTELEAEYERERKLSAALGSEREHSERLQAELELARKVVEAAMDWADAVKAYDAGVYGSSAYLRAREQFLYAAVREYREPGKEAK